MTSLGPYRLQAKLGAGAMGEVWRAIDTRLDREVAVKLLPPALAQDPERRARMLREAKAAAAVPHPNVVTLHDIGSDDGQDYLVMELVDGRTVAELLAEGKLETRRALDIAIGVADALAAAHQRGILHRDVKAANVMVTGQGAVKVLDFGLAKLRAAAAAPAVEAAALSDARGIGPPAHGGGGGRPAEIPAETSGGGIAAGGEFAATIPSSSGSETREGTLLGTPAYFSPEQVQGRLPDEKSEIFTLGILVYELLEGHSPFAAHTIEAVFVRILEGKPEPPGVPEPLAGAVLRALAFAPEDRYPDMGAFAAALRAARDQLYAPPHRARWPWVLAAAACAAGVAGGVAWWALRPTPLSPVDRYLEQAIAEWDVYYNDKAMASLRAAMRVAPDDPLPYAYEVLMGHASDEDRRIAAGEARARAGHARRERDRDLVQAAVTLASEGPAAARVALEQHKHDRELVFWDAELAYQAGDYSAATAGYTRLLASPGTRFRGRVYDHDSACLLTQDRIAEAVTVGEQYARDMPGEADAVGSEATAYAAAGRLDEALRLAQDALALHESEDTLAGLGKVRALRGELREAESLYRRAVASAPDARRPLRRAALAMLMLLDGRAADAREAVAPCLKDEAGERTVSVCLLVAGLADPTLIPTLVPELMARAHPAPPGVPYGHPEALARILRASQAVARSDRQAVEELTLGSLDLYATYHLPFYSSFPQRMRAEARLAAGSPDEAVEALLAPLEARPADVPALLVVARAHAAAGARDAARADLDRIARAWPTADADGLIMKQAGEARAALGSP